MGLRNLFNFAWPSELRSAGILGMNHRNAEFVLPGNPRAHYPRVDDKLQTKTICEKHGIPVPRTYAVVQWMGEIPRFRDMVGKDRDDFVVKPTRGAEGRGIIVVTGRDQDAYITAGGHRVSDDEMRYHLQNALSGLYSLSGLPDRVIVEQRIVRHPVFEKIAVGGTPDVRIILFRQVPVMAMVRLPTSISRGKANLHQGAAAAAVDLATGTTFGGVCQNRAIREHPDTHSPIAGVTLPMWPELVRAAMKLGDALEMDYVGVDFVLDAHAGPVVLEANARPGLAIQIANRHGLLDRLLFVKTFREPKPSIDARLQWVASLPPLSTNGLKPE